VPSNITFGIMPPLERPPRPRQERQLAMSQRALDDLAGWLADSVAVRPAC
jgi:folate-dependent tRNA-U54 methylase TrmFO/GidA